MPTQCSRCGYPTEVRRTTHGRDKTAAEWFVHTANDSPVCPPSGRCTVPTPTHVLADGTLCSDARHTAGVPGVLRVPPNTPPPIIEETDIDMSSCDPLSNTVPAVPEAPFAPESSETGSTPDSTLPGTAGTADRDAEPDYLDYFK